ncbi:hypothetical protein HELRODRAFT_165384 [Helobdella robusta]|uniref:Endonuclease/exonuclease/phosphatase domain-containing protein n=1 Tax=Helobdella robusta TaxID=6412 RepID=T1EWP4_HELRO|nr:hypothetical protein HELRODRAFT_165384 [Helobdella robusta]ESN91358.1 hypothetical protein HELRODRAFT_165384 [Helobdella robusta]
MNRITESQRGKMKMKFTVRIWNVRSLWQAGTYAMLKKELERFRYDVIGLCEKARRALIEYNSVNDRYVRFEGYLRDIIVTVAYAPTTNHLDDEVETFYEQTLKALPEKDVKIIVGDWNAKIGNDNIGFEKVMEKYGVGDRND